MSDEVLEEQKKPDHFSFEARDWPAYKIEVEMYFEVSKVKLSSLETKRNTLLYIMGAAKATAVMETFGDKVTKDTTLKQLIDLFDKYFSPKKNEVLERGAFWDRNQRANETNNEYITVLYNLIKTCDYKNIKDEMLRDKLCHGMKDRKLAAELRDDEKLTVETVTRKLRTKDRIQEELRDEKQRHEEEGAKSLKYSEHEVDELRSPRKHQERPTKRGEKYSYRQDRETEGPRLKPCMWCGQRNTHRKENCPAARSTCYNCGRRGHYSRACKQSRRNVNQVERREDSDDEEEANSQCSYSSNESEVLGAITIASTTTKMTKPWRTSLRIGPDQVTFKVDSGADVSVITEETYQNLTQEPQTTKESKVKLVGPSGHQLKTDIEFETEINYKNSKVKTKIYVVRHLRENLLSRDAAEKMDIIKFYGDEKKIETIRRKKINKKPSPKSDIHTPAAIPAGYKIWDPVKQYPNLFNGLGKMKRKYKIKLKKNAKPHAVTTPRRVAYPIQPSVKNKLDKMEGRGVISKAYEPTEWCAAMVPVIKGNLGEDIQVDQEKKQEDNEVGPSEIMDKCSEDDGSIEFDIRICIDLTYLNEAVVRDRTILPSIQETMAKMAGAKVFSKLDCRESFHQVELHPDSKVLTTFVTPWGCYFFNRLTMGLNSASEYFHGEIANILEPLEGCLNHIDDIAVWGKDVEEHDRRLRRVLEVLQENGITLNKEKCLFRVTSMIWIGSRVSQGGVQPDPEKVKAIVEMTAPTDKAAVKSLYAKTQFLREYVPEMADMMVPITDLLREKTEFVWGPRQMDAFNRVKQILIREPVLVLYDPAKQHRVTSDASNYALGAVLEQEEQRSSWRPVAYASRRLTDVEMRYAVIEKEALAVLWACKKFDEFILGKVVTINTDHKPLITILGKKNLEDLSPRLQRIKLKLMRYAFKIEHIPGRNMGIPDLLSRHPPPETTATKKMKTALIHAVNTRCENYGAVREAQAEDTTLKTLKSYVISGFPNNNQGMTGDLKKYRSVKDSLSLHNDVVVYNNRIVVPATPSELRQESLKQLHEGHLGVNKMKAGAKQTIYWPGMGRDIETYAQNCPECRKNAILREEPLLPAQVETMPWTNLAMDVADINGENYLVIVDAFSKYPLVHKLTNLTSSTVIKKCHETFSMLGMPSIVRSDNALYYTSQEFRDYMKKHNIKHITSSPHYPKSNGQAEAAVKIVKKIYKTCKDPHMGLLAYRNTPIPELNASPAQLIFSRQLRTGVPVLEKNLNPRLVNPREQKERQEHRRANMKRHHDNRHGARSSSVLRVGQKVWITDLSREGIIIAEADTPRSYWIETRGRELRRNRSHLRALPDEKEEKKSKREKVSESGKIAEDPQRKTPQHKLETSTRAGRRVRAPRRLDL